MDNSCSFTFKTSEKLWPAGSPISLATKTNRSDRFKSDTFKGIKPSNVISEFHFFICTCHIDFYKIPVTLQKLTH